MKRALAVVSLVLAAVDLTAGGLELTPDLIRQAIADEKGKPCYELKEPISKWSWGGSIGGCFTTPYSRVVAVAQAAKRIYKPFTEADVTPDLLRAEIDVIAFAEAKQNVQAIVIAPRKAKGADGVIQPITATETPTEFQNLYGARFEGVGLTATFPLSVLAEENEVRIVTSAGERRAPFKLDKVK